MPFKPEFLEKTSKRVELKTLDRDFGYVKLFIIKALEKVSKTYKDVRIKDVDIYLHGSYVNNTNIYFPSNLEIIVELKKTLTFDPATVTQNDYKLYNNYFVDMEFDFSPADFRNHFFAALAEVVGQQNAYIERNKSICFRQLGAAHHRIDIVPCFSFRHIGTNNMLYKGIILYDRSVDANILSFPRIHSQNGNAKDLATNGRFKKCVRMFKTLNAIMVREGLIDPDLTTGYFIECLLYNVPNQLFLARDRGVPEMTSLFAKILNFLLHCDLDYFGCVNMIWSLFGNAAEFWTTNAAEQFLASIQTLHEIFPETRMEF
jgi:hypothetical protein